MEVGRTNDSEDIFEFIETVVGRTTNRLCYGGACAARDCVFGYIYTSGSHAWGCSHQFSRRSNLMHHSTIELGDQGVGSSAWASTGSFRLSSNTGWCRRNRPQARCVQWGWLESDTFQFDVEASGRLESSWPPSSPKRQGQGKYYGAPIEL